MTSKIITIGNFEITVTRHKKQKNLYIRVSPPDGAVNVSAPAHTSEKLIRNFVMKKVPEIVKIQERMLKQYRQTKREYVSGESCYYLGKPYMLIVIYEGSRCKIRREPNKIIMTVPENTPCEKREKLMTEWYRAEFKRLLPDLIARCEQRLGIKINACNIRKMKTRWGSCNISKRSILLNLQLVKKPLECIEYVLTHEFVHLLEKNHTNRFRSLMDKYFPYWREAKKLLSEMPLDHFEKL